jgi:hypothetical protein
MSLEGVFAAAEEALPAVVVTVGVTVVVALVALAAGLPLEATAALAVGLDAAASWLFELLPAAPHADSNWVATADPSASMMERRNGWGW